MDIKATTILNDNESVVNNSFRYEPSMSYSA